MECELCLNPWNTDIRIPKLLSCGHTFCQPCLMDILKKLMEQKTTFKCPSCKIEMKSITKNKDILNLPNNNALVSLVGKIENQKTKTNTSNASLSMSFQMNNVSYLNTDIYNNSFQNEDIPKNNLQNNSNNYKNLIYSNNNYFFPICQIHKNKSYFFITKENKKYHVCNECLKTNKYENLEPIPNLKAQNEYKINSCKNKTKILKEEINRIENFLNSYQKNFEIENKKKIKELFDYINQIVLFNKTTAETLFNQCKKEQQAQIDKKSKELCFLKKELDLFTKKLNELSELNTNNPLPESQIELDSIYNKLGNYLNYENEINLFTMNIIIKEEIKESLFKLIQTSCQFEVDFLKMKNGELPTVKDLLNKSKAWPCNCGDLNNIQGKIICNNCSKYRPLETYKNILFNPLFITKTEKKEYQMRRKHEWKVFQSLMKKNLNKTKNNFYFAIDSTWFNNWRCFVSNDLTEKILSNNEKHISENKKLGVLPPGIINNIKLSDTNNIHGRYKLKPGLKIKKDYFVLNQLLWEWFLLNYDGGPEIIVENNNECQYLLLSIQENNPKKVKNNNNSENKFNTLTETKDCENNIKTNDNNEEKDNNNEKKINTEIIDNRKSYDLNDVIDNDDDNTNNNQIKIGIKIKSLMNENIDK